MSHPKWTWQDKSDALNVLRFFPTAKQVGKRLDKNGKVEALLYLYGSQFVNINSDCFPSVTDSYCYNLKEILEEETKA